MIITIRVDVTRPLSGRALIDGEEQSFEGWLQLLEILSGVVDQPET